jgi:hypothetical protein
MEVESEIVERFLQCDGNLCGVLWATYVTNMNVTDGWWAPDKVTAVYIHTYTHNPAPAVTMYQDISVVADV